MAPTGGRIARIFVAKTPGVVLPENTPEACGPTLSLIDQLGVEGFDQPSSLEDEITIIAKALAQAY